MRCLNPSTCPRTPFRGVTPAPSDGPQPTLVPPYAQGVLSSPYWTASMPKHGGQRQRSGAVGGVHTCTLAFSDSLVKMSQVHEMRRGKAATALSSRMSALWTPKMVRPAPPYHLGALIRTLNKPHVAQLQGLKHELFGVGYPSAHVLGLTLVGGENGVFGPLRLGPDGPPKALNG